MNDEEIAIAAYAAYGKAVDWKNYRGEPMPKWTELPGTIRLAWTAACASVVEIVCARVETALTGARAAS